MKILEANIPVGIGDLIYIKSQLDLAKDNFDQINITFDDWVLSTYREDKYQYIDFLNQFSKLLFNDPFYKLNKGIFKFKTQMDIYQEYNLPPVIPNLKNILPLDKKNDFNYKYIVINTKCRYLNIANYAEIYDEFWIIVKLIAKKYKIIVLGERVVEETKEYKIHGKDNVYSIYSDVLKNIPHDCLIDLTVPKLGITTPNLNKIRYDASIMRDAEFVINLGLGGSFCIASSVANLICYRFDNDLVADFLFGDYRAHNSSLITKNKKIFLEELKRHV